MKIENKDVFRCDNISSVRRFLSLRDVLKLEMFGDEGDDGARNLESTVQGLKELYPNVYIPDYENIIEELSTNEKSRYGYVDIILDSLEKDCNIPKEYFTYAIWACDNPEDVADTYGVELEEVNKYHLPTAFVFQDLDTEGKLYGVSKYPEEIYEESNRRNSKMSKYDEIFKKISESSEVEQPENPQVVQPEQTQLPNKEVETGYYHFANGEDEVSKLVQSIRNGNDTEDKQFLELVDRDLDDWIISPVAVEIMKMSMMENEDDIVKCYDKIDSLFSETVIYKKVNEPDENAVITEWNQIWDDIGDGKNPLDYYIVSQDRSDGLMRTYIYVNNGYSWYYVASLDLDEVKDAFMDYCYETGDYSMIPKILGYLHNGSDIFSNGTSIV